MFRYVSLFALSVAACGLGHEAVDEPWSRGTAAASQADLSRLVPWKAVDLVGPTDRIWEEYDYRPRAQGGFKEDIDATLDRLKAIGVRQVQIQTMFAWSVETAPSPRSGAQAVVYYKSAYRPDNPATWGNVPRTRRGDMGLIAYQPPAFWDQPVQLKNPLEINARAEQVLGELLDAVARKGLIPVLKSELYLVVAEDPYDFSGDFNFTDPSRNFTQFYAKFKEHQLAMTRLAARHGAALVILGTELPYVAGAGERTFVDGSSMVSRRTLITSKWKDLIQAARAVAVAEGRPDMAFSYTEINPFWDGQPRVPVWQNIGFWDDLDAVGINFYLPGRFSDGAGNYDTGPKTADDMVVYGETHNFATDFIPNLEDIRAYFVSGKGYGLSSKPILFPEDGCTSSRTAAANPAAPPFLTLRQQPDFTEQKNLYEAHFKLWQKHGGGWLAGLGFWQVTPTSRWGGAWNPANTTNYSVPAGYFNFMGTPTESVVATYFSGASPPPPPPPTYPELLSNPGFESGASPWTLSNWGGSPQLSVLTGNARSGTRALRIVNPNSSSIGAAQSQVLTVTAGATYQASAYVRLSGVTSGGAVVSVDWFKPDWTYLGAKDSATQSANTTGYVSLSLSTKAPAGAGVALVYLYSYAAGTTYFDDASMRRTQ